MFNDHLEYSNYLDIHAPYMQGIYYRQASVSLTYIMETESMMGMPIINEGSIYYELIYILPSGSS